MFLRFLKITWTKSERGLKLNPAPEQPRLAAAQRKPRGRGIMGRTSSKAAEAAGKLTHRTSVFIRRSMLVLLNFVLPLFCISLVSGP